MDKFISERRSEKEIFDHVELEKLPKFSHLKDKVGKEVCKSTWWDLYGVDWFINLSFLASYIFSLFILRYDSWILLAIGTFIYGWVHSVFAIKCGHLAPHGALWRHRFLTRPMSRFFVEFCGQFSEELVYDIHIKNHHPHTNIIGRGDSSTWKAPFVPSYMYMFVTPWMIPALIPVVSLLGLAQKRSLFGLVSYICVAGSGFATAIVLLMNVSSFSLGGALLCTYIARGMWSVPYLHINIFQHIGLAMYSEKSRPIRIYQMATGCLNLPKNPLLSYAFGHSVVSCHVEHHLFPKLSDNMCLKIKPVVSKFFKEHDLPYQEDSYTGRVRYFLEKYETLMVNAPPITHFVGIQ